MHSTDDADEGPEGDPPGRHEKETGRCPTV
jgi:hypothetical protein